MIQYLLYVWEYLFWIVSRYIVDKRQCLVRNQMKLRIPWFPKPPDFNSLQAVNMAHSVEEGQAEGAETGVAKKALDINKWLDSNRLGQLKGQIADNNNMLCPDFLNCLIYVQPPKFFGIWLFIESVQLILLLFATSQGYFDKNEIVMEDLMEFIETDLELRFNTLLSWNLYCRYYVLCFSD